MNRPAPHAPISIEQLVKKLENARSSIAYEADKHYYDRHHPERSAIDTVFDQLIEWALAHHSETELAKVIKSVTDPDLQPTDLIVVDGTLTTVQTVEFHAPHNHSTSGLPQVQAATEIVTGTGTHWFSLAPQA
ncbi:hypothetical protein ACFVV7_26525 [Streptomyces globisporus]|uniref:hypothetical protein n=1 Tax=Streptomyces globisporus TaxID=1908 RepID=UPI0036DBBDAE